jgi:phospholipase/carboxylesterase
MSNFIHRFIPTPLGNVADAPTLLLLHGTGGDEDDLIDLGRSLLPTSNLLSPRGKVLENQMPRFFRRLAEGVFDEADLVYRTSELAQFITDASQQYGFSRNTITAVGYSNGANIAASLLLLHPGVLARAVLLRAMVPLTLEKLPKLDGTLVFLSSGTNDPILSLDNACRLASMLQEAGATVDFQKVNASHTLTEQDIVAARDWLAATAVEQA